jgi:hypothetical protein
VVPVPERDVSAAVQTEESLLEADALTVTAGAQGPLLALLLHYALQLETEFPYSFFSKYSLTAALFRIRIRRIRLFLGLLDPDPLVRGTAPDLDPSIIKQK